MQVGVRRERRAGERRVAATPETVQQLRALGLDVAVESNAGAESGNPDAAYAAAGASIVPELTSGSLDVLLHVRPLEPETAGRLRPGTITIGFASPGSELPGVGALAAAGVTSFALELVPRISRAQSMDALSSQALVVGLPLPCWRPPCGCPRFFPLYMTAAGTIPPARVLVLGAGVAGLQAIGTAKRLGARVSANDIRAASADEVASMGGTFIRSRPRTRHAGGSRRLRPRTGRGPGRASVSCWPRTSRRRMSYHDGGRSPAGAAPLLVTADMVPACGPVRSSSTWPRNPAATSKASSPAEDIQVPADGGTVTLVGLQDAASACRRMRPGCSPRTSPTCWP